MKAHYLLFMLGEQLVMLLQLYCLLSMEFSVVLKGSLDVLDANAGSFEFFISEEEFISGLLRSYFEIVFDST